MRFIFCVVPMLGKKIDNRNKGNFFPEKAVESMDLYNPFKITVEYGPIFIVVRLKNYNWLLQSS